jgi:predicted DNA-binding WGR domain protein
VARFYSLIIKRDLFGRVVLVRNWGRVWTPPGLQGFS